MTLILRRFDHWERSLQPTGPEFFIQRAVNFQEVPRLGGPKRSKGMAGDAFAPEVVPGSEDKVKDADGETPRERYTGERDESPQCASKDPKMRTKKTPLASKLQMISKEFK